MGVFFLINHAALEIITLFPRILVFMGKLSCCVHALVEKYSIAAVPGGTANLPKILPFLR